MIGNEDEGSTTSAPKKPRTGSRRGTLTIVAIFIAGGIFVGGLWFVSRQMSPTYLMAELGTPSRTMRVASRNVEYSYRRIDELVEQVRSLDPPPDFLMVQKIGRKEAHELAQALDMRHGGTVQMFYTLNEPMTAGQPGNAILSKWPLYQGRTMVKGHPRQFGIFAEAVVEGKRFLLGCWDLAATNEAAREASAMLEAWRAAGEPPMIVAGSTSGLQDRVIHEIGGGIGRRVPLNIAGLPKGVQRISAGDGEVWVTKDWTAQQAAAPMTRPTVAERPMVVDVTGR
jgi:hypothetical protein